MIVTELSELVLYPVEDRGIPNSERIAIYAKESVNMGRYGVMVGHVSDDNSANPFQDNFFWFGDGVIKRGDWILLYTGKGEPKAIDWKEPGTKVYSIHWGRGTTMFANTNIVPILFRLDAVNVGRSPSDLPQLGGSNG